MELHKPQGFVTGGPAMNFQQIAMNNQSKQNDQNNQGIMNVIKEPVMLLNKVEKRQNKILYLLTQRKREYLQLN